MNIEVLTPGTTVYYEEAKALQEGIIEMVEVKVMMGEENGVKQAVSEIAYKLEEKRFRLKREDLFTSIDEYTKHLKEKFHVSETDPGS